MGKYDPLRKYLQAKEDKSIRISFSEVNQVVGGLPPAAYEHRPWWANDKSHIQARDGWLVANWRTARVDMEAKELTFIQEKIKVYDEHAECLCGCGGIPEKGDFMPGHDQRLRVQIEESVGGLINLWHIVDAIQEYMAGEINEGQLGKQVRKHWSHYPR